MQKLVLYIALFMPVFILISCASVHQRTAESATEPIKMEAAWTECKAQIDCLKVKGFCRLPAAIHKEYRKEFLAYVRKNRRSVSCSRYKNMKYDQVTEVICENNTCRLIIP